MALSKKISSLEEKIRPEKLSSFQSPHHITHENEIEQLVRKIKDVMLMKSSDGDEMEKLVMIDGIQRLGLECYFRDEIETELKSRSLIMEDDDHGDNLHHVALRFRLLRQAGYFVKEDIFMKFIDKNGSLKEEVEKDTKGLTSLFEASKLRIPDDIILDEANTLSWNLINKYYSENKIIKYTLHNPYHKSLPMLTRKDQLHNFEMLFNYLHDCVGLYEWIKDIQDLAKVDIKVGQIHLQTEIAQVSRWWNDLGIAEVLQHARNQPAKWHMWSSIALPGPDKAELRTELTKQITFIYIIDDIFDVYGNLEDLTLFTEAVNKWNYNDMNDLPMYMKICLKGLFDTTNEMNHKVYIKYGWDLKDFLKKAWAELCNAFLVEARWFKSGYLPTTEEYLRNGIVSSGVYVVYATLFSLLGEARNFNTTHLWNPHPSIVTLTGTLLRFWDDLGSAKDENQDGHDGSFVACYMKEHQGSSEESARECVLRMISNAWKFLNRECLLSHSHSPFSIDFKTAFLNLARMIPIMYKYDDKHRLPSLEKHMKSLLSD